MDQEPPARSRRFAPGDQYVREAADRAQHIPDTRRVRPSAAHTRGRQRGGEHLEARKLQRRQPGTGRRRELRHSWHSCLRPRRRRCDARPVPHRRVPGLAQPIGATSGRQPTSPGQDCASTRDRILA